MSEEIKTNEEAVSAETPSEETTTEEVKAEASAEETQAPEASRSAPGQRRPSSTENVAAERLQAQRNIRFKRKVCKFCYDKNLAIDYKNNKLLEQFITDRGKILPRRVTGTCAKHQRGVAIAIKRARIIALLPFVEQ
jgi:small subunit ribosomal protein S18